MKIRQRLIHLILIAFLLCSGSPVSVYAADATAIQLQLQSSLKAGQAAFYNQDYPKAEQSFRTAANNAKALGNSSLYAISYSYLGFSQVYLDKLQEAETTLKQAEQYAITPGMTPIAKMLTLLAYIEFYSRRGDITTEQKYIQTTLAQDDASFQAIGITREPLLNLHQNNQILENLLSELSTPSNAANYVDDVLANGKIMRWNDETQRIKIYMASGNHIKGWNPEYAENFKRACLVWQGILNNKVKFEFVENASEPVDTVVTWHADRSIRAATTDTDILGNKLVKADIAFHLIDNSNQLYVPRAIYKLSLHELGHLLGISGHSRNPDDIMFPAATYAIKPSVRDAATLLELYARPAQITNPQGKTLSEYRKEILSQGKHPIKIQNH